MNKISTFIIALFFTLGSFAQEQEENKSYSFSLQQAVEFGLKNNYSSQISTKEIEKSLKQKWEIIAQGLPQISGNVDYQNQLKQPVTLLPAELAGGEPGTFVPVRFGTQQNLSGTATWNQLIFDPSYIVGIQSVKTLLSISKNAKTKTDQEVKLAIINAYGNVLLSRESVSILKKNIETLDKNYRDTQKIFENGLAEEEHVEQLEITLLGLKNNLSRSERMQDISFEMLNLTLGLPVDTEVTLTEDLDGLAMEYFDLGLLATKIPVEENIDYRIAENQAESAKIFVRLEQAKALPTLTSFVNYGFQGFSEKFTFFKDSQEYFTQSILGVSLNIPIFSSGLRGARTQQKKIEYEQALLQLEETKNKVQLEINSAKSDYEFSLENYQTQKRNLELSERIENKNQIKFFEGLASSFELSEAQRQLYAAQQELLQSMLNVITNKVALENLLDTSKYSDEN
ncbi:TolC family protein [Gillisia limnaea]|uniref:Outer membrane efflux protein n=1 Tax=Gillisia limnaea (strain DSM 15749 / LMG 21470 / R-8282) TaxID=865937 RepID=H2BWR9_GILLR|nr:TolC family protein [Gillisia limnaea]EHQ03047.1 outer membrane efflux protein [Gillisia limnaea DSM 15749]